MVRHVIKVDYGQACDTRLRNHVDYGQACDVL